MISGKGGTGKTTLTASFAALARNNVIADCDVDAPDLHLLLHPQIVETQEFKGSKLACVDKAKCVRCGLCVVGCRFDALNEDFLVDPLLCEGCGVCAVLCPEEAINLEERISGYAYLSQTKYGFMAHARLNAGEASSGKLVTLVRHNARQMAEREGSGTLLIDGPPGIGCPVIASISGVDVGLVVTEPTLSGIHDLKRALQLMRHFNVSSLVCVNMYDINKENTERIIGFCEKNGISIAGEIPFDPIVTEAMVAGKTVVEYAPKSTVSHTIEAMWRGILSVLERSG